MSLAFQSDAFQNDAFDASEESIITRRQLYSTRTSLIQTGVAVIAGDIVLVYVATSAVADTTCTVTDNDTGGSNTYEEVIAGGEFFTGADVAIHVFKMKAKADNSNLTITASTTGSSKLIITDVKIGGPDLASVVNASAFDTYEASSSTSHTSAGITTTTDKTEISVFWAGNFNNTSTLAPTADGFIEDLEFATGTYPMAALYTRSVFATGTYSNSITSNTTTKLGNIIIAIVGASNDVAGTVATTQSVQAIAAAGSEGFNSNVADSQVVQTIAASGLETFTGTSATIQAKNTSSVSGLETFSGTAATTQVKNTIAAAGTETFSGTAATTQVKNTIAAAGTETFAGTAATTQVAQVVASVASEICTAAVATTQSVQTLTAAGSEQFTGTAAITQAVQTISSSGSWFAASVVISQSMQTLAAAGVESFTGTAATTQAVQTIVCGAAWGFFGTVTINQAVQVLSAAGVERFNATIATLQSVQTLAATGVESFTGTAAITQVAQALNCTGSMTFVASAATTQAVQTIACNGNANGAIAQVATAQAVQTLTGAGAMMFASATALSQAIQILESAGAESFSGAAAIVQAVQTIAVVTPAITRRQIYGTRGSFSQTGVSVVAGDLVLVYCATSAAADTTATCADNDTGGSNTYEEVVPGGEFFAGADVAIHVFKMVAKADNNNLAITFASTGSAKCLIVDVKVGANTDLAVVVDQATFDTAEATSSTSHTSASATTTNAKDEISVFWATTFNNTSTLAPTADGFTEDFEFATGAYPMAALYTKQVANTGTYSNAITTDTNTKLANIIIAIKAMTTDRNAVVGINQAVQTTTAAARMTFEGTAATTQVVQTVDGVSQENYPSVIFYAQAAQTTSATGQEEFIGTVATEQAVQRIFTTDCFFAEVAIVQAVQTIAAVINFDSVGTVAINQAVQDGGFRGVSLSVGIDDVEYFNWMNKPVGCTVKQISATRYHLCGARSSTAALVTPVLARLDWSGLTTLYSNERTNYCPHSEEQDDQAYVNGGILTGGVTDPSGEQKAFTFTSDGFNDLFYIPVPVVGAGSHRASLWIRRRSASGDLQIMATSAGLGISYQYIFPTSTWQRFGITSTPFSGYVYCGIRTIQHNSSFDLAFSQVEPGTIDTSNIPNDGDAPAVMTDYVLDSLPTLNTLGYETFIGSAATVQSPQRPEVASLLEFIASAATTQVVQTNNASSVETFSSTMGLTQSVQTVAAIAQEVFSASVASVQSVQRLATVAQEIFSGNVSLLQRPQVLSSAALSGSVCSVALLQKPQRVEAIARETFSGSVATQQVSNAIASIVREVFEGTSEVQQAPNVIAFVGRETFNGTVALVQRPQASQSLAEMIFRATSVTLQAVQRMANTAWNGYLGTAGTLQAVQTVVSGANVQVTGSVISNQAVQRTGVVGVETFIGSAQTMQVAQHVNVVAQLVHGGLCATSQPPQIVSANVAQSFRAIVSIRQSVQQVHAVVFNFAIPYEIRVGKARTYLTVAGARSYEVVGEDRVYSLEANERTYELAGASRIYEVSA